ncbi:MAG: hypothetical protein HQL58_01785 [Magnetococcales bacterium]|nr:hypothetical protein [Magnetococcales bacterium]
MSIRRVFLGLTGAVALLQGCSLGGERAMYVELEARDRSVLPLAPHVVTIKARPTPDMVQEYRRAPMRFMLLDKRTLHVHRVDVAVGERRPGPWGGWIEVQAFVPDLLIRDGRVVHGPEGHVNPVVWVLVLDGVGNIMHEGWMFARDSAQTAWDHRRFDLTFVGAVAALRGTAS